MKSSALISKKLQALPQAWLLQAIGRDRLEYFCSNTMNSLTRRLAPFLWTYDLKALVLSRRSEAPNVVSFELLPNTHWQTPRAGQYVEVSYKVQGQKLERAYSISGVSGSSIWITIKRQGKMSNALHEQLQIGDQLALRGPFGEFVYQGQRALLLICAGSGITPCFALLEQLLALPQEQRPDISFYAQFSRPQDTIFAKRLHQLQQQPQASLKIQLAYSQQPAAGSVPPLNPDNFGPLFADFEQRDIYLCGPVGFKEMIQKTLAQAEFPFEQLYLEHFASQTVQAHQAPELEILPEVYFSAYNCRIQMRPEDRHKSLLELGLEHGLNLEKGCRKGYCGSCKLVLQQGQVQGQTQGKAVYICSAYASSERVVLGY